MFPVRCANTQDHQNCCAVKSHSRALATFQNNGNYLENKELFEWNVYFVRILIRLYIYYTIHTVCNSLKLHLLSPKISSSLKQIFPQCKIILEGTLIVSNLKMMNKMPTLPPWKNFCARQWIIVLSRFRFFDTFVLSFITNCLFLTVLLLSVAK